MDPYVHKSWRCWLHKWFYKRFDLWASIRSFNGDFPPWICSGRQRRRGERRRHPLGNKPWKKELHHQDEPWIRSLERMLQWRKRKRERKREWGAWNWRKKKGEKLNFELCLTRLSFIKVTTSVIHASIYRLGSFLEKLSWENFLEKLLWENFLEKLLWENFLKKLELSYTHPSNN